MKCVRSAFLKITINLADKIHIDRATAKSPERSIKWTLSRALFDFSSSKADFTWELITHKTELKK